MAVTVVKAVPKEVIWRTCALPRCGANFDPGSPAQADRPGYRMFCSDTCALESGARRLGLRGTLALIAQQQVAKDDLRAARSARLKARRPAMEAARQAKLQEDPEAQAAAAAHLDARYGPIRGIARDLETRPRSRKVALECGHEVTIALQTTRARCRKCKSVSKPSSKPKAPRAPKASRTRGGSAEELSKKYGPAQPIAAVLKMGVGSRRVVLLCGHETTVPKTAKTWRCAGCRDGKPVKPNGSTRQKGKKS